MWGLKKVSKIAFIHTLMLITRVVTLTWKPGKWKL